MTQYAGQMLPAGHAAAVSPAWVAADGRYYSRALAHDYHDHLGWLAGAAGIYLLRVPSAPGWIVLLRDDPAAPELPPDTPSAADPPINPPWTIRLDAIPTDQVAGPVAVSGTCEAALADRAEVEAAPLIAGTPGEFASLGNTDLAFAGTVPMQPGNGVAIRVRYVRASYAFADSNSFNVAGEGA